MKVAFIKSINYGHFESLDEEEFGKAFVEMLKDASLHIAPNYYQNLVKRTFLFNKRMSTLQYFSTVVDMLHGNK